MKITSKKVMAVLAVLILAAVITATAGCTGGSDDPIVGAWKSDEPILDTNYNYVDIIYHFNADNSGDEFWTDTKESYDFTWKKTGSGIYEIEFDDYYEYDEFELIGNSLIDSLDNSYHRV